MLCNRIHIICPLYTQNNSFFDEMPFQVGRDIKGIACPRPAWHALRPRRRVLREISIFVFISTVYARPLGPARRPSCDVRNTECTGRTVHANECHRFARPCPVVRRPSDTWSMRKPDFEWLHQFIKGCSMASRICPGFTTLRAVLTLVFASPSNVHGFPRYLNIVE